MEFIKELTLFGSSKTSLVFDMNPRVQPIKWGCWDYHQIFTENFYKKSCAGYWLMPNPAPRTYKYPKEYTKRWGCWDLNPDPVVSSLKRRLQQTMDSCHRHGFPQLNAPKLEPPILAKLYYIPGKNENQRMVYKC